MNDCSFIRLNNVSKFEEWYHRFKKKTHIVLQVNVNHLLTLEMELTGPTQLTNTLHWDTDKASLPLKLRGLGAFKDIIAQSLLKASSVMMTNLRKTLHEKEIPFLNMVQQFFYIALLVFASKT